MHITLTGNLGSGKSTVCKLMEGKYGYEIYSTGKIIRRIASELGVSVLEMNELMSNDKEYKYDKMIDSGSAAVSRENPDKSLLFDSRLAWNFVEKSFKVFLSVDLMVAANRVYNDSARGEVESYPSVEAAADKLRARAANEDARYEKIYGIHYFDFNNYNLILDSSFAPPELVASVLISEANACEDLAKTGRMLMSPKRLGFDWEQPLNAEGPKFLDGEVVLQQEGDAFVIVEGEEIVKKAAAEGVPYVVCRSGMAAKMAQEEASEAVTE